MTTLFENAHIITPTASWRRGWLLVEGQSIKAIGNGDAPSFETVERIDATGLTLLPGFIDVHVHGAIGHESMDNSPDATRAMARFYAQHGVTSYLPTTWTDSRERIHATLAHIAEMQGPQPDGATILGVHLEGPYLDESKHGAQLEKYIRRADHEEATAFLDAGVIRLLSLAPEYTENFWLIDECRRRGITVSAAHTSATHDQMMAGIDRGVTHATHTFNAMVGLHHREPGGLGALLTRPEVTCEIIADTIHVHPTAMKVLYAAKGPDRVVLITDAVRAAGLPDGTYEEAGREVVVKDGAIHLMDGTLAGSSLTMDRALRNWLQVTGEPIENIWQCSSLNAARSIGVSDRKGSIEAGKDADIVLIDENVNVRLTMVEGRIVHQAQ